MNYDVKRKVLATLFGVILLVCLLVIQTGFMTWVQTIQADREKRGKIKQDLLRLERLTMEVDNRFRDYVLIGDEKSLAAMLDAESAIPGLVDQLSIMTAPWSDLHNQVRVLIGHVNELVETKRRLTIGMSQKHNEAALVYVKRGEGMALANAITVACRAAERTLDHGDREQTEMRDQARAWTRLVLTATTLSTLVVGVYVGRSLRPRARKNVAQDTTFD